MINKKFRIQKKKSFSGDRYSKIDCGGGFTSL